METLFISIIISVIGWIITIVIAVRASRSGSKDTDRKFVALEKSAQEQLSALEKSTKEQVESIKELTKIQIELSILQGNTELKKIAARHKSLNQKVYDETKNDIMFNQLGGPYDSLRQKENRRRDLMDDNDMSLNELKETHELLAQLNNLKKRIGGK